MKIPEMLRRKIDEIDITNGRDIKDVSKLRVEMAERAEMVLTQGMIKRKKNGRDTRH